MKRFFYLLCGLFIVQSSITSCEDCSKKVPCPAYNDSVLDAWLPYHDNSFIVFKNGQNISDTLVLQLTDSTVENEYSTSAASGADCQAVKSLRSVQQDSMMRAKLSIFLYTNSDAYAANVYRTAQIYFKGNEFICKEPGSSGFTQFSTSSEAAVTFQNLANYQLNGNTYPVVQVITADTATSNFTGVYKMILAKNYGIIAYETNPGSVAWVKQ